MQKMSRSALGLCFSLVLVVLVAFYVGFVWLLHPVLRFVAVLPLLCLVWALFGPSLGHVWVTLGHVWVFVVTYWTHFVGRTASMTSSTRSSARGRGSWRLTAG